MYNVPAITLLTPEIFVASSPTIFPLAVMFPLNVAVVPDIAPPKVEIPETLRLSASIKFV